MGIERKAFSKKASRLVYKPQSYWRQSKSTEFQAFATGDDFVDGNLPFSGEIFCNFTRKGRNKLHVTNVFIYLYVDGVLLSSESYFFTAISICILKFTHFLILRDVKILNGH